MVQLTGFQILVFLLKKIVAEQLRSSFLIEV